jgi:PAS domain S-box-containing protein
MELRETKPNQNDFSSLVEFLQNSPMGYCRINSAGQILDCNDSFRTLFPAGTPTFSGQEFLSLFTEEMARQEVSKALHFVNTAGSAKVKLEKKPFLKNISENDEFHFQQDMIGNISVLAFRRYLLPPGRSLEDLTDEETLVPVTFDILLETGNIVLSPDNEILLGYTPGHRVRKISDLESRILPEDLPTVKSYFNEALQNRSSFACEFRVLWPDESIHWLVFQGRPIFNKLGRALRLSGVLIEFTGDRKISETQKLTQKFVHDSEERYRSLVSILTSVVWTTDAIGQMVSLQESWAAHTGQRFSHYQNFGWLEMIHQEDREQFVLSWARALQSRTQFTAESRIWNKKFGYYRYNVIKAVPLINERNQIKEWVGTLSDIHSQRMAETALRESEERFRIALKNAPIVVASADAHLRYSWVQNSSLMFGDQQILGRTDLEIFEGSAGRKFSDLKKMVFVTKTGAHEIINIKVDGNLKVFDVAIEPLIERDRAVGITFAALDISEVKSAAAAAVAASDAKTQFLANMSHEIRTPIGIILGFSELAAEAAKAEDQLEIHSYIKSIHRNGEHLLSLIGGILDLSKIEADKIELEPMTFDVAEMVKDLVHSFAPRAEEKGLQLRYDLKGLKTSMVVTDPTRLRQILNNMVGNAIKFTEKGYVEIRLFDESLLGGEAHLFFQVKDTGIGLSNEQMEKLFMPFSQGDNSMSRKFGGTGLGLMVSRGLARRLGGDLKLVATSARHGSRFELKIPTAFTAEPSAVNTKKSLIPARSLRGIKVLLVEDSKDNQIIVKTYLKAAEAEVDVADDGFQGLEKARLKSYDVILMDIQMPGIDGYETLRRLQRDKSNIPVIALTAHALITEKEKALRAGFRDYITKPVHRFGLIERVAEILNCKERI